MSVNLKVIGAVTAAIGAHADAGGYEGDTEVQLWHLLYSLLQYCEHAGIKFDDVLTDAKGVSGMVGDRSMFTVVLQGYSLEAGKVGQDVGEVVRMPCASIPEALRVLDSSIAARRNGAWRFMIQMPDGRMLPGNDVYREHYGCEPGKKRDGTYSWRPAVR